MLGRQWVIRVRRLPPFALAALFVLLALLLAGLLFIVRQPVINYTDPDGPKFEGSFASEQAPFDGDLKVVTLNIAFAEQIEQAIADLRDSEDLQDA
ncbi:MAG: hypothetical protein JSW55_08345, partial [Chloroflexota bacterium]